MKYVSDWTPIPRSDIYHSTSSSDPSSSSTINSSRLLHLGWDLASGGTWPEISPDATAPGRSSVGASTGRKGACVNEQRRNCVWNLDQFQRARIHCVGGHFQYRKNGGAQERARTQTICSGDEDGQQRGLTHPPRQPPCCCCCSWHLGPCTIATNNVDWPPNHSKSRKMQRSGISENESTPHILSKLSCCVCPTKHVKDFVNLICMIHALPLKCWFLSRLWPSLWQCQMWSISSHFSFQSTLLGIWTWFYQSQVIVKSCRQGLSYTMTMPPLHFITLHN